MPSVFLPGPLRIVKKALNVSQSTLFKVQERLKQSEDQLFQDTIAWILKEKNAVPRPHYLTNF